MLNVQQGVEVTFGMTTETDLDTTVHWHGIRLDVAEARERGRRRDEDEAGHEWLDRIGIML
jgi:hypothetical protein